MADNLDLKIIIDTLLKAKGIEDAKAGLKTLTDTTNESAKTTDAATDKQKGFGKELGGSRGAAADLTRVLLHQIGVTGAAGQAAKAAGTAIHFMSGAASGVALGLTGFVAAMAFVIPKIIEWIRHSKELTEEQKALRDQLVGQLPALAAYARELGNVTTALQAQVDATNALAVIALEEDIEKLAGAIEKLEISTAANAERIERWARVIQERGIPAAGGLLNELQKMEAVQRQDIAVLEASRSRMEELIEAFRLDITVEELRRRKREATTKATRDQERATRELAAATDTLARLELDQIQDGLDAIADRQRFEDQQAKDAERDMAAFGRRQDAQAREGRKKEAERIIGVREREKEHTRIVAEENAQRAIFQADAIAFGVNSLASFFGKSKAAAIAGAIADTYAAAVAAYKTAGGGPWGIPIMLFTIAQGLAQVRQIESQNLGFDDPVNDLLAAQLGRKFAADVLTHINAGFGEGLKSQAAANTYNHTTINRGTTFNMGGVSGIIGSRTEFAKWFERMQTRAGRAQRRTSI